MKVKRDRVSEPMQRLSKNEKSRRGRECETNKKERMVTQGEPIA